MRNAIVQLPENQPSVGEGQANRQAIRQLERAGIYLAAVAHMELDDREAQRSLNQIRTELDQLQRHLTKRGVRRRA